MIKYPDNAGKKIEKIVDDFGLFNKSNEENVVAQVFNEPSVILSELVVQFGKGNLSDEEITSYLSERLDISKEKANKVKRKLEKNILSKIEKKENKKEKDKYREAIK